VQTYQLSAVQLTLVSLVALGCTCAATAASLVSPPAKAAAVAAPDTSSTAVPWDQIGAKAGADYQGEGLSVSPTAEGARLHCVFQRLDGEATRQGLWLTSTATNQAHDRFRVTAAAVGRTSSGPSTLNPQPSTTLCATGTVAVEEKLVRFSRPGLVEEYSVSMDGVRQDFLVLERPAPSSRPSPPVGEKVPEGRLRGMPRGAGSPCAMRKSWRFPVHPSEGRVTRVPLLR